jgi:hypothetical protein
MEVTTETQGQTVIVQVRGKIDEAGAEAMKAGFKSI